MEASHENLFDRHNSTILLIINLGWFMGEQHNYLGNETQLIC